MRTQLEATLRRMVADGTPPDVITFAGNGEPTMHPEFEAVIGDTIALRDALCPAAKVSVLSNATQIHRDSVRRALLRVDKQHPQTRLGVRRDGAADEQPAKRVLHGAGHRRSR